MQNVTKICQFSFKNCSSLKSLHINKRAKISFGCFEGCVGLTSLEIPNNNKKVTFKVTNEDEKVLTPFGYTFGDHVCYFNTKDTYLKFDEIKNKNYFYELQGNFSSEELDTIVIPKNVTKISTGFFGMDALKSIDLGCVKELEDECFECSVNSLTIPTTLTKIGTKLFQSIIKPTSIDFCGNKYYTGIVTKQEQNFIEKCGVQCTNLEFELNNFEYYKYIPMGYKVIGGDQYRLPLYLTQIIIPNGVSQINSHCFSDLPNLKKVEFPETLRNINYGAFAF
ncbi:hypothetical protein EIN_445710 [Entamoeba invadens IP1]|uniref:Leucine rich repeat containing protein BspA family protein n=1 Tax=Entamoeba invadens IP1 TaxID=370355 RepID=L7FL25_ENTIV|nr:hypothetical protein EIN_445710 [Entamoeba invadens IP1]ELP86044.1 hypothetical protein EIN_445710 [Entamoeba invadens IP1]|eukprot:XP_004185390.1 hypothetical protein EIN_445710 [Entamoeba invadens IP1]